MLFSVVDGDVSACVVPAALDFVGEDERVLLLLLFVIIVGFLTGEKDNVCGGGRQNASRMTLSKPNFVVMTSLFGM